jgi:glycosyltransferase involved in cell wall biosynthesis
MTPSVAIAVSGLGRIRRGSETWATDLAEALHARGQSVRLYGSDTVATQAPLTRLWAVSRTSPLIRWMSPRHRYLVEQRTFVRSLIRQLRRDPPSIVHLTDPQVAWWVRQAFRSQRPAVFYMDGLMLGPDWNWRFEQVQVLAPEYLREAQEAGRETQGWRVIPHFIEPSQFPPSHDRLADRARYAGNVSPTTPVVLAVGDFARGSSKRLHFIVSEIARIPVERRPHLLLVGNATAAEHQEMTRFAESHLGAGVGLHASLPRNEMAAIYRAADVFVHAALKEPFGIVLLEAMATGLPVIGHRFPVTAWIIGDGGATGDLGEEGQIANLLMPLCADAGRIRTVGAQARRRVGDHFSTAAVLPLYLEAYAGIAKVGR